MANEIWVAVPGWKNYQVSNTGKVKNIKFNRILKQFSDGHYLQTSFSQNNRRDVKRVHITVALSFINNSKNLPYINHKDGNKLNNHVDNLEWCTGKENSNHSVKLGLRNPKRTFKIKNRLLLAVCKLIPFHTTPATAHRQLQTSAANPDLSPGCCINESPTLNCSSMPITV
jgi:hypothetical protein